MGRSLSVVLAVAAVTVGAGPAWAAAPPANDDRSAAAGLGALPAAVDGTTVAATSEPGEPYACGDSTQSSVWYEVTAPQDGRIVVQVGANGDLDAVLSMWRRTRSQLQDVGCSVPTDRRGKAWKLVDVRKGETYLIRVGRRSNSVTGTFRLAVVMQPPPPSPPGPFLPARGALARVDALLNPSDAWSANLTAGVTYRVNLSHSPNRCVSLRIWGPGVESFQSEPTYSRPCGGYMLLTPGPGRGGRWSFFVQSTSDRGDAGRQYRLKIGRALADDMAPGRRIGNYATAHGRLEGGLLNKVDVYTFDVTSRSYVVLRLGAPRKAGFDLQLVRSDGGRIRCACGDQGDEEIRKGLRRGRYLVIVRARHRARGAYALFRSSRTITATRMSANGERRATIERGASVRLGVRVSPHAGGPLSIVVDRFDPLSGWHYRHTFRAVAHDGEASVTFTPSTLGAWRAYAVFRGTRVASPSESRYVHMQVVSPLRDD